MGSIGDAVRRFRADSRVAKIRTVCWIGCLALVFVFREVDAGPLWAVVLTVVTSVLYATVLVLTWVVNTRTRDDRPRRPRASWRLRLLTVLTLDPSYLDARQPGAAERYWRSLPPPPPSAPPKLPTVFLDADGNRIPPPPEFRTGAAPADL